MALLIILSTALLPFVSGRVDDLTPSTFTPYLEKKSGTPVILEFFAPWCGHCQKLEPHFKTSSNKFPSVSFVRVDGSVHYSLCVRFGVVGYPTLFYLTPGEGNNSTSSPWEVRSLPIHLFEGHQEGLRHYLEGGGWKQEEPVNWWKGPWGPLGLAKFHAMTAFEAVYNTLVPMMAAWEVPIPGVVVHFFIILALLCILTSLVIHCAMCCGKGRRAKRGKLA